MCDQFLFLQDFLDELEGKTPNSPAVRVNEIQGTSKTDGGPNKSKSAKNGRTSKRRSSVSDGAESLSRSASDSSVSNPTVNHNKNGAGGHG